MYQWKKQFNLIRITTVPISLEKLLENFEHIDINFFGGEIPFSHMEEVNEDQYTGDDTNHPDYGNRWTDWDTDLDSYIKED